MSANSANIRMLRALSKAFYREAGFKAQSAPALCDLLAGLSTCCNEAAEDLNEQDRLLDEPLKPKPGDPVFRSGKRGATSGS